MLCSIVPKCLYTSPSGGSGILISDLKWYGINPSLLPALGTILWGYLFPNMVQALKTIDMIQD